MNQGNFILKNNHILEKLDFFKYLKKPSGIAFICSFFIGILIHLFALVNVLHNFDDTLWIPEGVGMGVSSGRWFLQVLAYTFAPFDGIYNLPYFNGLLFIFFISLAAAITVSTFKISSNRIAALIGIVFVSFPSVASTMLFRFVVDYYGFAIFIAALSVWVLDRYRFGLFFSSLLIACSMGIYQAYLPFIVSMFVLLALKYIMDTDMSFAKIIRKGLYYCLCIFIGVLFYFLFLKICIWYFQEPLSSYQGIDEMGNLSLASMPLLIARAIYRFFSLSFTDYGGITQTTILQIIYIISYLSSLFMVMFTVIMKKKHVSIIILTLFVSLAFTIAVALVEIMSPNSYIYTIMLFSYVWVFVSPAILFESLPAFSMKMETVKKIFFKVISIALCIVIFSYAYISNMNYTSLYYANRQAENYLNGLVVQVRMTEGFDTNKKWAFIGNFNDPLFSDPWQDMTILGGNSSSLGLINATYSNIYFVRHYFGYTIPMADSHTVERLEESEEIKAMPCWPNDGSVKILDDTIVIKLDNIKK